MADPSFQAALAAFQGTLTAEQRREFLVCSRGDVENAIQQIQTRLNTKRRQTNFGRIKSFLEG